MAKNKAALDRFNLSSIQGIFTGAAPLGAETAKELQSQYPSWKIRQGYGKKRRPVSAVLGSRLLILSVGLTETSTVICSTPYHDVFLGSSGSLIPSVEAKIVSIEGTELGYDQPGELVVRSPSVVLGYLNNPQANEETFQDGWMRTGDEAVVRKSPQGNEHIFIVDRIKELIKVKVSSPRDDMVWIWLILSLRAYKSRLLNSNLTF